LLGKYFSMTANDLNNRREEIEALVLEIQEGNHDSFAKLYDIFIDPIYRYVYYRVKSEDAEDIVETVFLKVWENIARYKQNKKSHFSSWVFRIAHNLVVDHYRGVKDVDTEELLYDVPDTRREHNPIKTTERTFQEEALKKALNKLKRAYKDVLVYKFINDFSNAEIAEILKKSEGSIRILQFRALKALKGEFEKMGIKYHF